MKLAEGYEFSDLGDVSELIRVPSECSRGAFALRVEDDTMFPEFSDGEIIVVEPYVTTCTGCFVVARVGGDSATTFKQLILDGGRTFLKPYNERYPILDVSDTSCQILGVVIAKMKRYHLK